MLVNKVGFFQLHNEYACGDKLNKETNNRMSTINGDGSWGQRKDRQLFGLENKREATGRAFSMANCLAGDVPLDNCYVFDLPKSGTKNASNNSNWHQKVPLLWLLLVSVSVLVLGLVPARPFRPGCSVQRPRSVRRCLRDLFHKQTAGKTARNCQRRCQITRQGQIWVGTHTQSGTGGTPSQRAVCWQFALLHTSW